MAPELQTTAQANARAAQALTDALVGPLGSDNFMRHVVASPGSRHTPMLLALAGCPQVRLHMVLDERAAGFLALGLAKATGRAAIVCCTSGSAGAHYLPAVVEASASCVPLIVLTADRPCEMQQCGAPQTMPQGALFAPYVRRQLSLPVPEPLASAGIAAAWRVQGARARSLAETQAPGVVHLNLPFREPLWAAPDTDATPNAAAQAPARCIDIYVGERGIDVGQARLLAQQLQAAKRGLVVVGPMPTHSAGVRDAQAIMALATALGWPCLVDGCSQLRLGAACADEAAGLRISCADALLRQPAFIDAVGAPDVVLRFGSLPTSKILWTWLGRVGAQARVHTVLVDAQGTWHDPAHLASTLVVCSPSAFCRAVQGAGVGALDASPPASDGRPAWRGLWQRAQSAAKAAIDAQLGAAQTADATLTEADVAHIVCGVMSQDALLHVASSMPIRDIETFGHSPQSMAPGVWGPRISCSRGTNGIDGTLATLLGLALAEPESCVVGLLGDLAFLHDVGSLQLARQLNIRATAIVINNAGGDIFANLPIANLAPEDLPRHAQSVASPFDAYFRTPQKADMGALCRAAHVDFCQVTTRRALRRTLQDIGTAARGAQQAADKGRLQVIEVVIDADVSRRRRSCVHAAVARALSAVQTKENDT